jgi:hypothetical protein
LNGLKWLDFKLTLGSNWCTLSNLILYISIYKEKKSIWNVGNYNTIIRISFNQRESEISSGPVLYFYNKNIWWLLPCPRSRNYPTHMRIHYKGLRFFTSHGCVCGCIWNEGPFSFLHRNTCHILVHLSCVFLSNRILFSIFTSRRFIIEFYVKDCMKFVFGRVK